MRLPQREANEWKVVLKKNHAGRWIRVVTIMIVATTEDEEDELRVVTVW